MAEQLPGVAPENILLEPERRNTAPCIALGRPPHNGSRSGGVDDCGSSDHIITRDKIFEECVLRGFEFVESHPTLLTLGINPTRPETGYGYIQIGSEETDGILKVKTFTEKPDIDLARVFVESGEFFWNSGIFMWKARTILDALAAYAPDLAAVFDAGTDQFGTPGEIAFINEAFPTCPSISIDYSVMEKADNVYVGVSISAGAILARGACSTIIHPKIGMAMWPITATLWAPEPRDAS